MEYRYMQAKELSETKFYQIFERQLTQVMPGNKAGKDDVTEFQCQHDIVTPSNQAITNKSVFCTRAYKDFPKLFDVLYIAISVDKGDQALLSHFTVAGVTQNSALKFTEKFMESISWK
jgi:hypothetical protein